MATRKVLGCGGRYSAYAFRPCSICQSKHNPIACAGIQKKVGQKHFEWYTDFVGRARWEESKDIQHECNEVCEDEDGKATTG